MVVGDQRKYLSALITLKVEMDTSKGQNMPTHMLTENVKEFLREELGVEGISSTDEAIQNEIIMTYIQAKIDENNKQCISRAQNIRKFRVLPTDFSKEGGELTPTLKLMRRMVVEKYRDEIESMYPPENLPQLAKM
jgi:long-chain acyl-CoA synthetase